MHNQVIKIKICYRRIRYVQFILGMHIAMVMTFDSRSYAMQAARANGEG